METTIYRDTEGKLTVSVSGTESPEVVTLGYKKVTEMLNMDRHLEKKEEPE
ncbi:hypothetical protein LCGC14_2800010 [marine sediment metagenome]|uniref:Uncharacterized protein n=1 Tax=marine sediment metagenome TaxID=412755 RepID=A0A0F8ZA02_9ZZZZ